MQMCILLLSNGPCNSFVYAEFMYTVERGNKIIIIIIIFIIIIITIIINIIIISRACSARKLNHGGIIPAPLYWRTEAFLRKWRCGSNTQRKL
jgi:hypothetical protein